MCTYSFQQVVCSCAKGVDCPQMSRGRAVIGGEVFHHVGLFFPIDDLGAACDYQRRLHGRHARPTMTCPRYNFDEKRVIKGSYKKSDLACVKCAETCAPPSMSWQAPGPDRGRVNGEKDGEKEREREMNAR
ncbi:hypothetical protein BGZ63DRAFT_402904 [Mariannaea sp. PMI_226]|nr:hypothetical protein BGZ63DRAFT_402904 [Mariannaea sp. PMI_226]